MFLILLGLLACGGDDETDTDAAPADTDTDTDTDTDADIDTDTDTDSATPSGDTGSTTDTETTPVETGSTGDSGFISPLLGQTFRFSYNSVSIPGIYGYFGPTETVFLLEVTGATSTTLDVRVGSFSPAGGGSQNLCVPTTDALGADFSTDPELTLGPLDGTLMLNGLLIGVEQATSQLRFNATYDAITDATFEGAVDVQSLSNSYYGAPGYLCDILDTYYSGCVPCPVSGSSTCLDLSTTGGEARVFPGISLVARTQADILSDPACP